MTKRPSRKRIYDMLEKDAERIEKQLQDIYKAQRQMARNETAQKYGVTVGSRIFRYGGSSRTVKEYYVIQSFRDYGWPHSKPEVFAFKERQDGTVGTYKHELRYWEKA